MSFSEKLYQLLLLAYPASLRNEHGAEMLQLFRDQLRDARTSRRISRFWLRTLWDWSRTVVFEQLNRPSRRSREPRSPLPLRTLLIRKLAWGPDIAMLIVAAAAASRLIKKLGGREAHG